MKPILFALMLLVASSVQICGQTAKKEKEEVIKQLLEKGHFRFIARTALPMGGSSISLTSEYDLVIDSTMVKAHLPFYGRAYSVDLGSGGGGIKFEEQAVFVDKKFNKKRQLWDYHVRVRTERDLYNLRLQSGSSGFGNLSISSNNRQSISFYGIIEPIE